MAKACLLESPVGLYVDKLECGVSADGGSADNSTADKSVVRQYANQAAQMDHCMIM